MQEATDAGFFKITKKLSMNDIYTQQRGVVQYIEHTIESRIPLYQLFFLKRIPNIFSIIRHKGKGLKTTLKSFLNARYYDSPKYIYSKKE